MDSNKVLFTIETNVDPNSVEETKEIEDIPNEEEYRTVRYSFGPQFFKLGTIGTSLTFSVGD